MPEVSQQMFLGNEQVFAFYNDKWTGINSYESVTAGPTVQVRTDPSASFVNLAIPGTQYSDLSMPFFYSDISALVRGSGSNVPLIATASGGSNILTTTSSIVNSGSYNWSTSGSYTTSVYQEDDGSLGVVGSAALPFSSGSFVIETWFNLAERLYSPGAPFHKSFMAYTGASGIWCGLRFVSQNSPLMKMGFLFKSGNGYTSANITTSLNTWYHGAWVRSGNNLYWYLNGERVTGPSALAAGDQSATTFDARILGGFLDGNEGAKGNMQDLRISIGTDRGYTNATIPIPQSIVQKI